MIPSPAGISHKYLCIFMHSHFSMSIAHLEQTMGAGKQSRNRIVVPESIPGLLKSLKIPSQVSKL